MLPLIKCVLLSIAVMWRENPLQASSQNKPDLQRIYNEAQHWAKEQVSQQKKNPIGSETEKALTSPKGCSREVLKGEELPCGHSHSGVLASLPQKDKSKTPDERLIVFVSASMPIASLQTLLQEAQGHQATLVMRGLQGNSFKNTAVFIQKVTKGVESGPGIDMDPELFTRFGITHVPVFMRLKGDQELVRLSGNVSLAFAARKLREGA